MTNQQFKGLLESNGIKTREHQFFDFCFGKNYSIAKQSEYMNEITLYLGTTSSIYFDSVEIQEILVFFKNRGVTIAIINKGEFI